MATSYDPVTGLPKRTAQATQGAPSGFTGFLPGFDPNTGRFSPSVGGPGGAGVGTSPAGGGAAPIDLNQIIQGYTQLIQGDPILGQLRQDLSAQGVSDAAQRDAQIRQALIGFGEVPQDLPGFASGAADQQTRDLAAKNTTAGLSLLARITKQAQDAKRAGINQLAARGALRSGEAGHFLQENQLASTQARTDATQQLLQFLQGVQAAFARAERERALALAQARPDYPPITIYYPESGQPAAAAPTRGDGGPLLPGTAVGVTRDNRGQPTQRHYFFPGLGR